MKELKKESFIVIKPFMVTELKLKGNSLLLYALIHGITVNEGAFYGSIEYMQTWCNASNRNIIDCLQELTKRGLITKKKTGNTVFYIANISNESEESSLSRVKKVHSQSEESSHNNIYYNLDEKIDNNYSSKKESNPFPEDPKPTKKKTQTELTEEYLSSLSSEDFISSRECSQKLVNYLSQLQNSNVPSTHIKTWQKDFAQFAKAQNRPFAEIIQVIDFAFSTDWARYTFGAKNIIKNYGKIYQQMNSRPSNYKRKDSLGSVRYGQENYDEKF